MAQMVPALPGPIPVLTAWADVTEAATLRVELRICERPDEHNPGILLDSWTLQLEPGLNQCL
jgi:hypothetical protein